MLQSGGAAHIAQSVAYNNLGEAYRALGRLPDAVACYEQALFLRPDYAEAHYHLGLVLEDQGKPEEAIARYRKALSARPIFFWHITTSGLR